MSVGSKDPTPRNILQHPFISSPVSNRNVLFSPADLPTRIHSIYKFPCREGTERNMAGMIRVGRFAERAAATWRMRKVSRKPAPKEQCPCARATSPWEP